MTITNFSDRFIIQWHFGDEAVALYQANYAIASAAMTFIMVGIMRAVNPNILRAYEANEGDAYQNIWTGLRLYLLLAVPAAMGLAVLAYPISSLVLASGYNVAYVVMIWVALGMLTLGLSEYMIKPLELHHSTKPIFYASALAALINVALNLWLVKPYGYSVAAITTQLAYLVYIVVLIVVVRKSYPLIIDFGSVFRIVISANLMAVVIYFAFRGDPSFARLGQAIVFGMLIYIGLLVVSGELKSELQLVSNYIKRRRNN